MRERAEVEGLLSAVRAQIDEHVFEAGQCHTLALTLQQVFGGGQLVAIMRDKVEPDGSFFDSRFSHMIWRTDFDPRDPYELEFFDVGGAGADERWCER